MRRSASEVIRNLEGWDNDSSFNARVVSVEHDMEKDDFKKSVKGVNDLQAIFSYCKDKMMDQIIAKGKVPGDFDLSWMGGGDYFVFNCRIDYEVESGSLRDTGLVAYQIEIESAGIASLIMKNPNFFKRIRSNE